MIDLHSHSSASDGSLSPEALVAEAARRGLKALAITDHDTMEGIPRAQEAAKSVPLTLIPGVELDIVWEPGECHLLGLGIYHPSASLQVILEALAAGREERNRKILAKMQEAGIEASWEEIASLSEGKIVGRPHFAAFLVSRKIVKNREQAFDKYLAKGRPLYEGKAAADLAEAIAAIHDSGGKAILAHPLSLYLSWGRLPEVLDSFHEKGLDGIEAWHPGARKGACKRLEALALERGWMITAGSDFHGEARPERRLGLTTDGIQIDDHYMDGIPLA